MPINLQKAEFILSAASPKDFIRDDISLTRTTL